MLLYEKLNTSNKYIDYPENNLGEKIRKQRNIKGYTAEELGKLCGCAKNSIYAYESNIAKPSNDLLNRIINSLGVDANYFESN
ncbi:helix-turn-helix domain-containing protein [Tissierella sp.]|uniref:helix-turn-helix domain-containing protein n=1 Tax=Tissierella sp. TaxID=41274 RepID=UPI0037DC48F4